MQYDTFIFDLDGTLSDPLTGFLRCLNHALVHFNHPPCTQEVAATLVGPPLDYAFKLLTQSEDAAHITALVARYRERYSESGYAENQLYPGIVNCLEELSRRGIRCGVCTSKRVDFAERILERFHIRQYFAFVDGGDIGINKGQQLSRLIAAGIISQRALMIGDREVDVIAARHVGIASLGVLWGYGSEDELVAATPNFIIAEPGELLSLLT